MSLSAASRPRVSPLNLGLDRRRFDQIHLRLSHRDAVSDQPLGSVIVAIHHSPDRVGRVVPH